jgi:hypothetical protein
MRVRLGVGFWKGNQYIGNAFEKISENVSFAPKYFNYGIKGTISREKCSLRAFQ